MDENQVMVLKKFLIYFLLLAIGTVIASIYGIVNDQITYTISNEYFTKFKFQQFGIVALPDRLAVSMVGFSSSWWMGLFISLLIGAVGFLQKDHRKMFRASLESFLLVLALILALSIVGYFYGIYFLVKQEAAYFEMWHIPANLVNMKNYIVVGSIHNSAYLGGFFGIIAGIVWQIKRKME